MMNPGWEQPDDLHPFVANLTKDPSVGLADYIVKERIFNFFMYQGEMGNFISACSNKLNCNKFQQGCVEDEVLQSSTLEEVAAPKPSKGKEC